MCGPRSNVRLVVALFLLLGTTFAIYRLYNSRGTREGRISPDVPFSVHERDNQEYIYAIVFDAGSTGTRIHVYRFVKPLDSVPKQLPSSLHQRAVNVDPENGPRGPHGPFLAGYEREPRVVVQRNSGLLLIDELFKEVKPGLSAYSASPSDAADSIEPLLKIAKDFVPQDLWPHVPVALYATAGLRLLSDSVAQSILDETQELLTTYPFKLCDNCVRILDGLDEGVYGWYTINYLLGLTDAFANMPAQPKREKMPHSVGVIDLGGASLQITFLAHSTTDVPPNFVYQTDKFGDRPLTIYTHSYLGLGLNAARMQLLSEFRSVSVADSKAEKRPKKAKNIAKQKEKLADKPLVRVRRDAAKGDSPQIQPLANVTYTSPCLYDDYVGTFRFQNMDVRLRGTVRSTSESADRFEACYTAAKQLITSPKFAIHKPREVRRMPFYIQSYFFDRAVDAGLVNEHDGGSVQLSDYEGAAKSTCNVPKDVQKQPLLCMDLCLVLALLRDGFEFSPSSDMVVMKKIQNVELSWTLGAAFPLVSHLSH